tara:strand:+ start:7122 stop:7895 length:774 start_codon:yes stop_codon:yes gene_type:complete
MKKISIIGSGNVATNLALSLKENFFCIHQIYSRNIENAKQLANLVNSKYTSKIAEIEKVDLIIIAVSDDVINQIIENLEGNNVVHTSGSVSLDVFNNKYTNYGVLYPLQTFNKKNTIDNKTTPFLIESNNDKFEKQLVKIASKISNNISIFTSEQRENIHLAAVFACNFSNHMYVIANNILKKSNIDFSILLPLLKQNIYKIDNNCPSKLQTGPAKRKDFKVIKKQINQIKDNEIKLIYQLITKSIIDSNEKIETNE